MSNREDKVLDLQIPDAAPGARKGHMLDTREPTDPDDVRRFLDGSRGEREAVQYLRKYPDLVSWTFCRTGGHSRFLLCEFPLGSSYRADFVALVSYSGAWEAHYVELEPVDDPVFTKKGLQSQRLATAVRQVNDWQQHLRTRASEVRQDLVRWIGERDLLGHFPGHPLSNQSRNYLSDMNTVLFEHFHIVIGRSSKMSEATIRHLGKFSGGAGVDVVTYDRFVQVVAERQASLRRR